AAADERDAERHASEAREARARAEARRDGAREGCELAAERIMEALGLTPVALRETLDVDPAAMPASETIEADVARLKRQRDALGAVNLRAEEDAREVEAEHASLTGEKADLEEAIK
ncbi:MAG TPA: chromosome segregation protein SMC, partial [Roseovarius sp.]|nr:chromosome segregation protein SMC [Roseovarius sp.]